MKTRSASYPTPSKTREQIAEHIAAGYPSAVSYTAVRLISWGNGHVHPQICTPIHLVRAPSRYAC